MLHAYKKISYSLCNLNTLYLYFNIQINDVKFFVLDNVFLTIDLRVVMVILSIITLLIK